MRKLFVVLFTSVLIFACSEDAEEMREKTSDVADEAMEKASEMTEDAAKPTPKMAKEEGEKKGPKLEPLPDWDSLPPIEEMASEDKAADIMEKASEVVKEVAEEGATKAEEMVRKTEEMMKEE